mmetsp:Transcript_26042/g.72805  ORF Transcript_26042/g.72805 Transcript_26042/m.72805 type:complete len:238 (+) Transcript_26042:515-1228(+)
MCSASCSSNCFRATRSKPLRASPFRLQAFLKALASDSSNFNCSATASMTRRCSSTVSPSMPPSRSGAKLLDKPASSHSFLTFLASRSIIPSACARSASARAAFAARRARDCSASVHFASLADVFLRLSSASPVDVSDDALFITLSASTTRPSASSRSFCNATLSDSSMRATRSTASFWNACLSSAGVPKPPFASSARTERAFSLMFCRLADASMASITLRNIGPDTFCFLETFASKS